MATNLNKKQPAQKTKKSQKKGSGSSRQVTTKGKKPGSAKNNNAVTKNANPFLDEIILVFILMISILFLLSNFNLAGPVGNRINHYVFGLIGIIGHVLPFVLFFGVAFYLSNRNNRRVKRKLGYMMLMLTLFSGLLQLVKTGAEKGITIIEYYKISSKEKSGGGVIGGIISKYLSYFFGEIGAYVVLLAFIIILFILITERLVFTGIRNQGNKAVVGMKEKHQMQQEERENPIYSDPLPRKKAKTFTFQKKEKKKMEEVPEPDTMFSQPLDNKPIYEKELIHKFDQVKESDAKEFSFHEDADGQLGIPSPQPEDSPESAMIPDKKKIKKSKKEKEKKEQDKTEPEELHIQQEVPGDSGQYIFPSINLLKKPKNNVVGMSDRELKETAMKLQSTLESFGVRVTITNVSCGPAVTRYELQPEQGVKVSRITNLADDIKLNLAAADVRIEAPIPGKAAVGIEVPNKENSMVMFRELIENNQFKSHKSDIAFAVGKDIGGQTVVTDIAKMPHLLIAGATGSGKSVCINTLIMSILYKANPNDVKLIMVDPKVVELSVYNGIPHLLIPVVTDPKKASAALNWAVMEMTDRYNRFADLGVRDIKGYNAKVSQVADANDEKYQKLPQIVIIVDELADLMMVAPGEVEDAICRLAQMARAAGLHLIIATQRPSVNVITGLIKANIPSRIAFSVSSAIDSRTILDGSGAEKLLGKGDMLFFPSGYPKPVRIQGAFVSDKEVSAVVEYLSSQNSQPQYQEEISNKINAVVTAEATATSGTERDDYFVEAGKFIIEKDKASIGMLQRVYKIGFNRAARIMDQLSDVGVVGPEEGTKPRKVLMSLEEFENFIDECV